MYRIVLIRHGQSMWNVENRFTGWTDVDLTEDGYGEARKAGKILREQGFDFDCAYASVLKRSIRTLNIALDEMDLMWIPITKTWKLNERHYGALQGLNKQETATKYGEEQVHEWRRSIHVSPPALEESDERYVRDLDKYERLGCTIPRTENLMDTSKRVLEYWNAEIKPMVSSGKRVLISAHGNTLRSLVMHLDQLSEADVMALNIPTGIPLVYELNEELHPTGHFYLTSDGSTYQHDEMKHVATPSD
ncbi:2,3-diphosphoglycerate-dependent phosphoglycerate mutase [Paenibacillus silvae]|uniref:2,3-bisphosphoglycerate-dependent phosphoglycerate mutase n=1 Tax=Paenibacillus silvae TaxID=1325358 RepID=A0A2W6N8A0_9BACL|nr:2,3-diphosphoglycerate-dependent phosphoglycerate mutase [Paenibacillus silvae]PZT52134.1 2,3-diphosphoglycerate-dependent phosphoglycerate mutase [Paenibacillus silvae]